MEEEEENSLRGGVKKGREKRWIGKGKWKRKNEDVTMV